MGVQDNSIRTGGSSLKGTDGEREGGKKEREGREEEKKRERKRRDKERERERLL